MVDRIINPLKTHSFFLFGARGVGKTTLLRGMFIKDRVQYFDLLDPEIENQLSLEPKSFMQIIQKNLNQIDWVVIDEVQKNPQLLNQVHSLIESTSINFALTGSSARRLKQKGVNLLAGRAFVYDLFPLTHKELGEENFDLSNCLCWGTLPSLLKLKTNEEKENYLRSYALTYLKHEIQEEQWVRKLDPFRRFLGIAAQMNTKILNYSKIARDVGVDVSTVQSYFEILSDTLLGFEIPAYHRSVRRQQSKAAKFYFFDTGIKRALDRTLNIPLNPGTYAFGEAFEHWIVLEIYRLHKYTKPDWLLFYLQTKEHNEIDLVIDRPKEPPILIEIKSKLRVDEYDARNLLRFAKDFPKSPLYIFSLDPLAKKIGLVEALHWADGIRAIGL